MQDIRNIAIIAHVDHGKTTLVDKMMLAGKLFREGQDNSSQVLDANDLERERGITILSKNVSINWKGTKINIIDTPGHADFGGEVERVLNMADGCLLLVDAFEGPMPQTRFVLQKALQIGLKPIVVVNKVDKPNCRPEEVYEMVFDLMFALNATEDQLDFPVVYGSAKQGWMGEDWRTPTDNIEYLLDKIVEVIPAPKQLEGTPQMLITSLDYSNYTGRILLLAFIVMVKMSDIGAYAAGRIWGRHKLIPAVSPAKTVEGLVGGYVLSLVSGFVLWAVFQWGFGDGRLGQMDFPFVHAVALPLLLTTTGVLGDLSESLVKRSVGVKDSSSRFPGMGGVLDILDSLLFSAPFMYAYVVFFVK